MQSAEVLKLRVSMTEAASLAGVSYSTIQKDVSMGVLPAQRVFRGYSILIDDLEEYVRDWDNVKHKRAAYYRAKRNSKAKAV